MADAVDAGGRSAETALLFEVEPSDYDPALTGGPNNDRLAAVWSASDHLRELLTRRAAPDDNDRSELKSALIRQLPTLWIYWKMTEFLEALAKNAAPGKTISLYVLLFPGEARDNTGIKDLNDKVIGEWWNSLYIRMRNEAITNVFDTDGFAVAGGNYKTALIATLDQTRADFVRKLAQLDEALRQALLNVVGQAASDPALPKEYKDEIKKLSKKLAKKGYRFDIYFGLRTLKPQGSSVLSQTFLLTTEALKGAGLARYVAKGDALETRSGRQAAAQAGIGFDKKKLDPRGKEYVWNVYIRVSDMAEKIKSMVLKGQAPGVAVELNAVYIDTVWTWAFIEYKHLFWGNPDAIRDVRKKKLKPAPVKEGNVQAAFSLQKDLLELWLVVLNLLDFVKRFKSEEFSNKLQDYHDKAFEAFKDLAITDRIIDWDRLTQVLTRDVRQTQPIAVNGTASEFQFYSGVSDYQQRLFFSMDIRDLGVELMLDYEASNREIGFRRYSDEDLLNETLRSTDPIDARQRFTYDAVVDVFRKYHRQASGGAGSVAGAVSAVQRLRGAMQGFGAGVDQKLGAFEQDVEIMLGGDEVYVAAHPLFTEYAPAIIRELADAPYGEDRTLDMRAAIGFSKAKKVEPARQREATQLSHQEAMRLSGLATGRLKTLERTERRIERLIDMIEANDKKKKRAPGYRKRLAELGLRRLFARVKHGKAEQLRPQDYTRLYVALLNGDGRTADEDVEIVDFTGRVVDRPKLEKNAQALEDEVRKDVGPDNVRVQGPPIVKMPKWIEKILDELLKDEDNKKKKGSP